MTNDELMILRYKATASFWNSPFSIGDIIELSFDEGKWYWHGGRKAYDYSEDSFKSYPHLFRRLEWWEDRRPGDLPKYVKNNVKGAFLFGKIYKPYKTLTSIRKFVFKDEFGKTDELDFKYTLPSTEEEFNAQKK